MSKKLTIIGILIALAITGYFIYGAFATSNPHSWTNGLVGYWSFDGQYTTSTAGTRDVSNNGNWGAFNGGVKPVGGVVGQALSFDGVDDYIQANVSQGTTTVEFWMKSSGGAWQHIINSNGTYYVNGVVSGTPSPYPIYFTGLNVQIGKTAAASYFNGSIDEVRIYNRALSADEVKQHYDQTRRNLVINNPSGTPPVGWWKMDEATGATVRDYSVNANNGTVSNGGYGATSTDGKIQRALDLDGSDDYVKVLDNDNLDLVTAHTMEAWIKLNSFPTYSNIVAKSSGGSTDKGWTFSIHASGQRLAAWYITSSGNHVIYYSGTFTAGTWHHVVVTYDSAQALADKGKFYIDGIASIGAAYLQTGTFAGIGTNALNVNIGSYGDGAGQFFNGLIDDVRIYNYARTADQIAADYRAGAYRTIIGTSVPSTWWTNGLVGYWSFDGQYTTSTAGTRDVSNNNNWGTFSGGVKPIGGISGQALNFDGSNDYVSVAHSASISPSLALTLSAWVNTNNTSAGQAIITKHRQATSPISGYLFAINAGGTVALQLRANNICCQSVTTSETLATNTWYHLVATYNNETMKIYINGALAASVANSGDISSTQTLNIGRDVNTGTSGFMKGLIDEVRIYSRALSADEILQHYQQTRRNLGI